MMKALVVFVLMALAGCVTTGGTPPPSQQKMAEGYYLKGLAHLQEKRYELALSEFHRSIQTDSTNKWSYYYLGYINDLQDKLNDSVKFYKEAISLDSDFSEAYNALGAAYSRQQKWPEAIKAYHNALENKLYTTPHLPWLNIGRVYMAQKNYPKAIEAYQEAKRYVKQDFIIYELGTALLEAGKNKEAVAEFQEGVQLIPQNASMRYSLATAYLKDGKKSAAIAEFKKAIELAPKSDVAGKAKAYLKTLR
jgi:type IV pilus assembly protein PilF